ncbi:MAG TPA: DUF72 domain-containing protein [Bryobacteraceae bacterium]|nr:DUF72 domain-containing protein [Bryobacteraceae bacterium]
MEIRIGTSGWHYKHWLGPFYPEKLPASKMLAWYAGQFDTVELNTTFYRLPPEPAVDSWRDDTSHGFLFAAKASRFITHMKKLKDPEQSLERYFERVDRLRGKLGPIVFQLPPNWQVDLYRFDEFLKHLPRRHRYAFEFRNETWNDDAVLSLMREHRVAYCIFDLAGYQSPFTVTADFVYVRLHGPDGKYQGCYSDAELNDWASRMQEWGRSGLSVYVYFDNDDSGYAPMNALSLRRKVEMARAQYS